MERWYGGYVRKDDKNRPSMDRKIIARFFNKLDCMQRARKMS